MQVLIQGNGSTPVDFTPDTVGKLLWQGARDVWTLWVEGRAVGQHEGVHVASLCPNLRTEERKQIGNYIRDVMNGVRVPNRIAGKWEAIPLHSIALDGRRIVTLTSRLDPEVRQALTDALVKQLNGVEAPEALADPEVTEVFHPGLPKGNLLAHLLTILQEECNETGQRSSKALRFGLGEIQPGQPLTNADRLIGEYADIVGVMELLQENGYIQLPDLRPMIERKKAKVLKYLEFSRRCGTLID